MKFMKETKLILEACVETLAEAITAEDKGADRIELCANLSLGGTTPSYATIESALKILKIPVMVMIRPRGGNFSYTEMEIKKMEQSIEICKELGVHGIVFGVLTADGAIDQACNQRLADRAENLEITFHKAIDETQNIIIAARDIMRINGITRILTSGGMSSALEGVAVINQMIEEVASKITIIAAGKITSDNLHKINSLIHTHEFHGKKIVGSLNQSTGT